MRILSPFAPHLAEELWEKLSLRFPQYATPGTLVSEASWPEYDPAAMIEDELEIVVQINGKLRDKFKVAADAEKEVLESKALELQKVQEHLKGVTVRKVIVVPKKLVNIVAN